MTQEQIELIKKLYHSIVGEEQNEASKYKYMNAKSIAFINEMKAKYRYDKIKRKDPFVVQKVWDYKITDLASILKHLERNGVLKVVYKNDNVGAGKRIDYFQFI